MRLLTIEANRIEAFHNNRMVGYTEGDKLYVLDRQGYAVEIGSFEHRNEIIDKLNQWKNRDGRAPRRV